MPSSSKRAVGASEPRAKLRLIEQKMKTLPLKDRMKLKADVEDLRRVADCLLRGRPQRP
jgi:hypothetical protein